MISLDKLDRAEAVRYLGGSGVEMNDKMEALLDSCEEEILSCAAPKYLYKKVPLKNSGLLMGSDIKSHLSGCEEAVVLCAALGAEVDRHIRLAQVSDMARAVVLDAMASVAVEQVCNRVDELIKTEFSGFYLTWRFSPGYGDYPLELQGRLLQILDAPRKIGLCVSESSILTPTKSVTALVGLSEQPLEKKRRGCAVCNLRESCQFRKKGERCEF